MKKAFIVFALAMVAISASAQEGKVKNYTREGNTFVAVPSHSVPSADDTATAYKWRDAKGNEYTIYLHTYKRGEKAGKTTAYVIRKSAKSGQDYKYYLPNGEQIAEEIMNENQ